MSRSLQAYSLCVSLVFLFAAERPILGQVVPGTGVRVEEVGDDFEDPKWGYTVNLPKSSNNLDEQVRLPGAQSHNRRWSESALRGTPDHLKRVETPEGGLPGSTGALLIRTLNTGIPNRPSFQMQQDDLLASSSRMGNIPVSYSPNFVVRVYLPPFDEWENRTGTSFGIRGDVYTTKYKESSGLFSSRRTAEQENYWPGMFIHFNSKTDGRHKEDSASIIVRSGPRGYDIPGPAITETGWWTFGMSYTPDGRVHYYAKPGVDDLTADDLITSQYPYSYRCERFNTFFFNISNADDGRTWSTPWIIDDPALYIIHNNNTAQRPAAKR